MVYHPISVGAKNGSWGPKIMFVLFVAFCFILNPISQEVTEISRRYRYIYILRLMKGQVRRGARREQLLVSEQFMCVSSLLLTIPLQGGK